jgi:hypothetical protein
MPESYTHSVEIMPTEELTISLFATGKLFIMKVFLYTFAVIQFRETR